MYQCRVCSCELPEEPLIRLENVPKVAQFFPDAGSIDSDQGINLTIFQCSGCGLVQTGSEPVHYYKEVVRATAISQEMTDFRRSQFDEFVRDFSLQGKKILEVGSGSGEYLQIMNQLDVDAYGLEYSAKSVRQCCQSGLNVIQGFVENDKFLLNNAPFDAFYMLNFLEHLPQPNSVLRGICNNLAEGAIGLVEVPNSDMILQKNRFWDFTSDHLLYFTKETLNTSLSLNGLEVLECGTAWHDYNISAVVRKRNIWDVAEFETQREHIRLDLLKFISRFGENKVAIWGAGHQALAMMALMNLSEKIKYVIDSANFKQNKFTPATHIPIVAPDQLSADPVDAVIIMAGGYSDEIAYTLGTMKANVQIAILRDFGLEENINRRCG